MPLEQSNIRNFCTLLRLNLPARPGASLTGRQSFAGQVIAHRRTIRRLAEVRGFAAVSTQPSGVIKCR